jgi:hypothetical protein
MSKEFEDLMRQAVEPDMHRKILLRAAERVAMGWTTGAAARAARRAGPRHEPGSHLLVPVWRRVPRIVRNRRDRRLSGSGNRHRPLGELLVAPHAAPLPSARPPRMARSHPGVE